MLVSQKTPWINVKAKYIAVPVVGRVKVYKESDQKN